MGLMGFRRFFLEILFCDARRGAPSWFARRRLATIRVSELPAEAEPEFVRRLGLLGDASRASEAEHVANVQQADAYRIQMNSRAAGIANGAEAANAVAALSAIRGKGGSTERQRLFADRLTEVLFTGQRAFANADRSLRTSTAVVDDDVEEDPH
ncbi:unnamed protein product [Prorocentrum cordatum]|uniref:Uncharacterized protein n=1 Tax=Prorocentrum cordatum TaxID=2364126 RepID=A0ABN9XPW4_9DINO|nr:unnamed protein product [Polarella glacialis]